MKDAKTADVKSLDWGASKSRSSLGRVERLGPHVRLYMWERSTSGRSKVHTSIFWPFVSIFGRAKGVTKLGRHKFVTSQSDGQDEGVQPQCRLSDGSLEIRPVKARYITQRRRKSFIPFLGPNRPE